MPNFFKLLVFLPIILKNYTRAVVQMSNGMFLMKNLQKKENQNYEKKPSKDRKIEAYLCMSRFS